MGWVMCLGVGLGGVGAFGADKTLVLRFTRNDCVKELGAAGLTGDSLVFNVSKQRRIRKTEILEMDLGLGWATQPVVRTAAGYFLGGMDTDQSHAVPGEGVVSESFVLTAVAGKSKSVRVRYSLKMKVDEKGEESDVTDLSIEANAVFAVGDWAAFLAGKPVEIRMTPAGERCFERTMGAHLDSGNPTPGEGLFMLLQCQSTEVATTQDKASTVAPMQFRGTRYALVFQGPSSVVDQKLGTNTRRVN